MRRARRLPVVGTVVALILGVALVASAPVRAEGEMSFRAVRLGEARTCGGECPIVIAATGQITQSTPSRFLDFIETHGNGDLHAVVFLDSPGGRVVASMEFGTLLRKVGAAVVVARVYPDGQGGSVMTNAQCFSACVYALMGAKKRVIPAASQIGIHRMFVYEDSLDASGATILRHRRFDNGNMRSFLEDYSSEMGVSPGLIAAAETVPSSQLKILTRGEIRRWHLGVPRL